LLPSPNGDENKRAAIYKIFTWRPIVIITGLRFADAKAIDRGKMKIRLDPKELYHKLAFVSGIVWTCDLNFCAVAK
jgi:hypothetical protein